MLAEYDGYGACLREYIYIGAKMVAEYHPVDNKYYYYTTTDQINSTRVVTDDLGNVVYAAAHDPYGGMHQTWTNTFNPELKFSGKEQDTESGLYYFGARYYDPTLYRFLSPDPVINMPLITDDIQQWNLYSYCRDNPVTFIEYTGLYSKKFTVNIKRIAWGDVVYQDDSRILYMTGLGLTLVMTGDVKPVIGKSGKEELLFELNFDVFILVNEQLEFFGTDYSSVLEHELSCHVHFVSQWVDLHLDWVEKKWLKEKESNPDRALENAKNRYRKVVERGERLSKILFDLEVTGIVERLYRYWKDIDSYWIPWEGDPFMTWLLRVPFAF